MTAATTARHVAIIRLIPIVSGSVFPRTVGTGHIVSRLREMGYTVSRRTIERDLQNLADKFGMFKFADEGGYLWWARTASLDSVDLRANKYAGRGLK